MAGSARTMWIGSVNDDRPSSHVVREDSGPPSLASRRTRVPPERPADRPATRPMDQSPFAMLANNVQ